MRGSALEHVKSQSTSYQQEHVPSALPGCYRDASMRIGRVVIFIALLLLCIALIMMVSLPSTDLHVSCPPFENVCDFFLGCIVRICTPGYFSGAQCPSGCCAPLWGRRFRDVGCALVH